MRQPRLIVVAGCNGSGKSSFSNAFTDQNIKPYDYDLVYKNIYNRLIPTDFIDVMAQNLARENLELSIYKAIENRNNFCYETNFDSTPLYWPKKFKQYNYHLEIIYFSLDSITKAKERVRIRYENGGHFVPDEEIEKRYELGFININKFWNFFDKVSFFDTSNYNSIPEHIFTLVKNNLVSTSIIPNYLKNKISSILDQMT
ncbi:zeta toxin family protein [Aquimarina sp. ERC-38]|uniref:zeta toxin family protein n=1 Tax=Aquimarina sp. ERC-38 TaxID=2949996 RepID=UPI0022454ECE|nr:zeta toxin family protein [Aquimarina sp. ERC-38]UZO80993.1 zeta toxin family protein [Aquimarina sp. ERC-38]